MSISINSIFLVKFSVQKFSRKGLVSKTGSMDYYFFKQIRNVWLKHIYLVLFNICMKALKFCMCESPSEEDGTIFCSE